MKIAKTAEIFFHGLNHIKNNPPRLFFAFHRVSKNRDTDRNPFNNLACITPFQLEKFIQILKPFVRFEGLENTLSLKGKRTLKPFLHFTFDDVSRSFLTQALPLLEKHQIPVTIFPSIKNTEFGYSWRDKIYFILENEKLQPELTKKVSKQLGAKINLDPGKIYTWSKLIPIPQNDLERIIDDVLSSQGNDFFKQVASFKPYLNWDELSTLSHHPLVTIGNHGYSHYDYNRLSETHIAEDLQKSHSLIEERIGMSCRHFSVPFGGLKQESYLAVDKILSRMQYHSVGWSERCNNPLKRSAYLHHYFRIDGAPNFFVNLFKILKAIPNTKHFPLSGIRFSVSPHKDREAKITETVSIEEYKTFYHRLFPDKMHHLNEEYIKHLYNNNPFGQNKPKHFAIKSRENVFAMGSLFYIPFCSRGERQIGAYFCGWNRFPELPSPDLRARVLFEKAQSKVRILGAYHPSPNSLHFYKTWDKVKLNKLRAKSYKKKISSADPQSLIITDQWNSRLQPIIDESCKKLILTVQRGPEIYKWRIEGYPLCRFHYCFPSGKNPSWFVIFCIHEETMIISDFCLSDLSSRKLISEMLHSIRRFAGQRKVRSVELETSNEIVLKEGKKHHYKCIENNWTVYNHPKKNGQILPSNQVHETQLSGDLLPRIFPPQKK